MTRRGKSADREDARRASEVARRAIRRLDILEYVMFAVGALLAMGGGAVVAWILAGMGLWDFRSAWIGASLVLFVVPGAITIIRIRRDERATADRLQRKAETKNG